MFNDNTVYCIFRQCKVCCSHIPIVQNKQQRRRKKLLHQIQRFDSENLSNNYIILLFFVNFALLDKAKMSSTCQDGFKNCEGTMQNLLEGRAGGKREWARHFSFNRKKGMSERPARVLK